MSTYYLDPNSDVQASTVWSPDSGTNAHYTYIDDGLRNGGTAPSTSSDWLSEAAGLSQIDENGGISGDAYGFPDPTLDGNVTSIKVWIYGVTGSATNFADIAVAISTDNASTFGTMTSVVAQGVTTAGWYSVEFTGTFTQTQINNLVVNLYRTNAGGRRANGVSYVYALYVELTSSPVVTVSPYGSLAPYLQPGLLAWCEADDLLATVTNGGAIATWPDRSSNANNLVQTTSGNRPTLVTKQLNGLPIVRSTNSDIYLKFTTRLTTVRTVYILLKHSTGNSVNYELLLGDSSAGGAYDWHGGEGGTALFSGTYASTYVQNASAFINGKAISGAVNAMTKPTAYTLLTFITTGNVVVANLSNDREIGSRTWPGDFAAVALYSSAHTTAQQQAVQGYMMSKWFQATDCLEIFL